MRDYTITRATAADIDGVVALYGAVCDHLAANINYSDWSRDTYPTRQTALDWLEAGALYVLKTGGTVVSTAALTHVGHPLYAKGAWNEALSYDDVYALHTVTTHPDHLHRGYSAAMMEFAVDQGRKDGMRALRLDVCEFNTPAVGLYEKAGFVLVGKLDLFGRPAPYDVYRLYEYVL